jgi:hypothetical protein
MYVDRHTRYSPEYPRTALNPFEVLVVNHDETRGTTPYRSEPRRTDLKRVVPILTTLTCDNGILVS